MTKSGGSIKRARWALERLYKDRCDFYLEKSEVNEETGVTETKKVLFKPGIRCRLSFSSTPQNRFNGLDEHVQNTIRLHLSPELEVPTGSVFKILHEGREDFYRSSGVPAVYKTHQEISLELEKSAS